MHSILMAPHGTANGLLGLGALINVCATLPANYIAFEYPSASDPWWEDIITGLPRQIVRDSMVDLLEAPGLGLDIDARPQRKLSEEDRLLRLSRSQKQTPSRSANRTFPSRGCSCQSGGRQQKAFQGMPLGLYHSKGSRFRSVCHGALTQVLD